MKATSIVYNRAGSLEEAVRIAKAVEGTPKYLAGGQSLMPMMNLRLAMSDGLIDISDLAILRETRRENGKLFIGAAITHAMLEDGKVEDTTRGYLPHVAHGIAYRAVRNKGTVGGSLVHADPAADWPTAMLALGAIAVIEGDDGTRQVPLADFQLGLMETCLGETEILLGVLLPELSSEARWSYTKFTRKSGEFAHSIGAVVIDARAGMANVVLGAAASKPVRMSRMSAHLAQGMSADETSSPTFQSLVAQDLADATLHAPDSYEFHLHRTIVTRALTEALNK